MAVVYPRLTIPPTGVAAIEQIPVQDWRGKLYCLLGMAHRDFVRDVHQHVTQTLLPALSSKGENLHPINSVKELRGRVEALLPVELSFLNSAIQSSRSMCDTEWKELAYLVHKIASAIWNLVYGISAKEQEINLQLKAAVDRCKTQAMAVGAVGNSQISLRCVVGEDLSVNPHALLLQVDGFGEGGKDLVLNLTMTDLCLVVMMDTADDTENETFLKIKIALELFRADNVFAEMRIILPKEKDLSPYGFARDAADPKGYFFYKSWLELSDHGPPSCQGKRVTWRKIIAQSPLLHSLPGNDLSGAPSP